MYNLFLIIGWSVLIRTRRPDRWGPRCGIDGLGQYKTPDMLESVRDGLLRPGGAFFQIGLDCVMSHHQSPHKKTLHIPVLILAGKFNMEFLPTISPTKAFPVAQQICPNLHKIVPSRVILN